MLPSNPVPQVCDYGTSAVYCSCPNEEQIRSGVVPLDSLPAAWWNWMWSKTNQAVNCARYAAGVLIDEVNTVLQQAGVCVCDTCVNQLYTAINNIRQTIGDAVTAGAVKSSSVCGEVSINAQGIMTANGLGNAALLTTTVKNTVGAINELKSTYDANFSNINTALGGKAPTSHASSATTYGVGSAANYGHLKISDQYTSVLDACSGVAASQKAVACVYAAVGTCATTLQTNIDGKAPKAHASSATTYGVGSASNYGHLKISDQYTSVLSACSGVAASQKAIACVYNSIEEIAAQVAPLANTVGCALGTAAAGTSTTVSRSDHVHPVPNHIERTCNGVTYCVDNQGGNSLNITPHNKQTWINYYGGSEELCIGRGGGNSCLGDLHFATGYGNVCGTTQYAECAACAGLVYLDSFNSNADRPVMIACPRTATGYSDQGVSVVCPLTFNPVTGELTAACFTGNAYGADTVVSHGTDTDSYYSVAFMYADTAAAAPGYYVRQTARCQFSFNPARGILCVKCVQGTAYCADCATIAEYAHSANCVEYHSIFNGQSDAPYRSGTTLYNTCNKYILYFNADDDANTRVYVASPGEHPGYLEAACNYYYIAIC